LSTPVYCHVSVLESGAPDDGFRPDSAPAFAGEGAISFVAAGLPQLDGLVPDASSDRPQGGLLQLAMRTIRGL
jgi:hypothetical protein